MPVAATFQWRITAAMDPSGLRGLRNNECTGRRSDFAVIFGPDNRSRDHSFRVMLEYEY